jgi:ABC transporter with metal-binding/Fe-S-binding domain ATP-binding protein
LLKRAAALYTGGKDSHYAIIKSMELGIKVVKVITVVPSRLDSWMFHGINAKWAKLHAELMNLDYCELRVSGIKEEEIDELYEGLKECIDNEIKFIVTGAVASKYQKVRIDKVASTLGIKHLAPLWGSDPLKLLNDELSELGIVITAIQAYGLNSDWLGKVLTIKDVQLLSNLLARYGINPVGEGGEFETFVISSPLFKGRGICIRKTNFLWNPNMWSGFYTIEQADIC